MLDRLFTGIVRLLGGPPPAERPAGAGVGELRGEVIRALEIEAQKTLDRIDDALTAWQQLELRRERERRGVELWERKRLQARTGARESAAGSEQRGAWERLEAAAGEEEAARRGRLAALDGIMEQARPAVEQALAMVEEIGLSRETALSQVDRLEISHAAAEARERLAAARLAGETGRIEGLLRGAAEEVAALSARADAALELAEALEPRRPPAAD